MTVPPAREALTDALQDADAEVRRVAAAALERLESLADLQRLTRVLEAGTPPQALRALSALGELGGPRALSAVVAALRSPLREVRAAAVKILGAARDAAAIDSELRPREIGRASCRERV